MTIERCTGPGTATFTSARYSATVDGVANYCWQWLSTQRAAYTRDVALGLQRQQTWCKWGSNQTVTLEITMLAGGPVTSYELFGAGAGVTGSIVAGKLRLVVPPFEQFRCDLNGDHQRPFYAWSSMLEDALPARFQHLPARCPSAGPPLSHRFTRAIHAFSGLYLRVCLM